MEKLNSLKRCVRCELTLVHLLLSTGRERVHRRQRTNSSDTRYHDQIKSGKSEQSRS